MSKLEQKAIETTRGARSAKVFKGFDPDDFYARHRGGAGNVVVVRVFRGDDARMGIFGSIETAQEWAFKQPEDATCVFCPFVVDEPDFGNVRTS